MEFINLSESSNDINLEFGRNQLQQKGDLVYEYNPLKTFRINEDIIEKGIVTTPKNSIIDLDTTDLKFSLNNPVDIITQPSYDGSVNLIINDGSNEPKLINTRFSPKGMDTYQIVDREGDNDTNIYDKKSFESDISLYKKIKTLPKLTFTGVNTSGKLFVGNYVFYFKLADADGNETDFISESSIVTCHVGNLNDPFSIQGGIVNEDSGKGVSFILSNIDSAYNYVVVYYTRSTSDLDGIELTSFKKLNKQYTIYNTACRISITGYESTIDVTAQDINASYSVVNNAKAQAVSQNMLFLGNVEKPEIEYKELSDLSLHFLPTLDTSENIGFVDQNYTDSSGGYEYYNVSNIYNKLGYWNGEIYKVGIVYLLDDLTLTPPFPIRGITSVTNSTTVSAYTNYDLYETGGTTRKYININKETNLLDNANENSRGVFKIDYKGNQFDEGGVKPIGLKFKIKSDALNLIKQKTKGFFFVRQKRIATTLCQAVTIGLENISYLPVLPIGTDKYIIERFIDGNKVLTHNFSNRSDSSLTKVLKGYAAISPEFNLRTPFFNSIFTGTEFEVEESYSQFNNKYFNQSGTHFYNLSYNYDSGTSGSETYNIISVNDNDQTIRNKTQMYSARAGSAEEAYKINYYNYKNKSTDAANILRGSWGPYIGLEGTSEKDLRLVNIKIPNYNNDLLSSYFEQRFEDASPYYSISDRTLWSDITTTSIVGNTTYYEIGKVFRGDCFIGNYTHRMCRNFVDTETPTNDDIVDEKTWKSNYTYGDSETNADINRGDVNAIKMGHWVTFKVCSNINLSMRCTDGSRASESGLNGRPRNFFPMYSMDTSGPAKLPESFIVNGGHSSTTSDKYNYEVPHVPAFKNVFSTRIMYSEINVNDSFKNGYRVFRNNNATDYPLSYGSITKLIEMGGNLLCVFEHGVALIPVKERTMSGDGQGGNVFITTANVLPDNPVILSDVFGSQWSESVIKTPYYVYGLDTVGKKIWRTNGSKLEVISDFKIQKFLNDNITLKDSEKTPTIGIRNVKTHYNAFKQDIMFTFYDDISLIDECAWNVCWNEISQQFTTFYSWIPSYSENVDNIFFSFDRTTSRFFSKLNSDNQLIYPVHPTDESIFPFIDITSTCKLKTNYDNVNNYQLSYNLYDNRSSKYCTISENVLTLSQLGLQQDYLEIPIKLLVYETDSDPNTEGNQYVLHKTIYNTVFLSKSTYYNNLTTAFWKHGQAGLMKTLTEIKPTNWYGSQHPFEFEFVINSDTSIQKVFDELNIISNKAEPESVHFEIDGEGYDFSTDKYNMFFRQEAIKNIYQYNGSNISFDDNYLGVETKPKTNPIYNYYEKSTMFPLFYSRVNVTNSIEDYYQSLSVPVGKDYSSLSGSEIIYDKDLSQFKVDTHLKICPIDKWYQTSDNQYHKYGRLRGNAEYLEDQWYIQIPPIVYLQKNESWSDGNRIALNLSNNPVPNDITLTSLSNDQIPSNLKNLGYSISNVTTDVWKYKKESKIRDKYVKIKIRYSGKDLAVILAINTLYTISYSQ